MVYLQLFWAFVKIGFTSFGGLSMLPLVSDEMTSHGWMTAREVTDLVAIAEMTPGPIGLNCASFAGMRSAGLLGALTANLGILMPTFTLCIIAAVCFEKVRSIHLTGSILTGIRPACIGMMGGVIADLSGICYLNGGIPDLRAALIGSASLLLILRYNISVPKIIGLSALLGVLLYGIVA